MTFPRSRAHQGRVRRERLGCTTLIAYRRNRGGAESRARIGAAGGDRPRRDRRSTDAPWRIRPGLSGGLLDRPFGRVDRLHWGGGRGARSGPRTVPRFDRVDPDSPTPTGLPPRERTGCIRGPHRRAVVPLLPPAADSRGLGGSGARRSQSASSRLHLGDIVVSVERGDSSRPPTVRGVQTATCAGRRRCSAAPASPGALHVCGHGDHATAVSRGERAMRALTATPWSTLRLRTADRRRAGAGPYLGIGPRLRHGHTDAALGLDVGPARSCCPAEPS